MGKLIMPANAFVGALSIGNADYVHGYEYQYPNGYCAELTENELLRLIDRSQVNSIRENVELISAADKGKYILFSQNWDSGLCDIFDTYEEMEEYWITEIETD